MVGGLAGTERCAVATFVETAFGERSALSREEIARATWFIALETAEKRPGSGMSQLGLAIARGEVRQARALPAERRAIAHLTFAKLAAESLGPAFDRMLVTPQAAEIHRVRTLLDVFAPAYPTKGSKDPWATLRRSLRRGDARESIEKHRAYIARPSEALDRSRSRRDLGRVFWGSVAKRPKSSLSGIENVARLVAGMISCVREELVDPAGIGAAREQLRSALEVAAEMPEVMLGDETLTTRLTAFLVEDIEPSELDADLRAYRRRLIA